MANKLTRLKLHEVSLVDSPANKHAKVMLFKRAEASPLEDGDYPSGIHKRKFTAEERKADAKSGTAMPGGGFPIEDESDLKNAIRAIGRAKDTAKAKAHIRSRAKALGLTEMLPDTWSKRDSGNAVIKYLAGVDLAAAKVAKGYGDGQAVDFDDAQAGMENCEAANDLMNEVNEAVCALGSAIWSIQGDETVSDKGAAVQESLNQFGDHVKTIVPEGVENALVAEALAQAGYTINPQGGIQLSKGADSMTMKAIAKSLGLPETASEADITAAVIKLAGEETTALKAALAKADKLAKMSAKHKAHFEKLSGDAADKFADMSLEDRDSEVAKAAPADDDVEKQIAKGDAFRTVEGTLVTKRDAGAMFSILKSQNDRIAKAEKDAADMKDDKKKAEMKDKAEKGLTLIGKADEIGSLLFQIAKHDAGLADKVEVLLKGANDLIAKGNVFKEHGNGGRGAGSAADAIQKGAESLLKTEPALKSIEKARTEFRKRNPEIVAQESSEATAARKAA